MAWAKELKQNIEDLETIMVHMNEGWKDLQKAKRWLFLENRFNALTELDGAAWHLVEAGELTKEMRGRYPGGANPPEDWHSSNEIAKDLRFALRRLEMHYYENGGAIDAVAEEKLRQALEKLGAGDGCKEQR